ncbi:PREDICTED: endomucin isoform X2 [Bison bison bison]|uniref:Endomucin isoform X2 n=1 Tax=Bison bison bison TaxID=43346 RepID=A0A6P3I437_BISBB|nr:PREDICTED: endomucin isoform X2 [Bison bison bison]
MKLLQGTIFCLLLSSISSNDQIADTSATTTPLSTTSEINTTPPTRDTRTSPNGTSSKEAAQMPHLLTPSPVTPNTKGDGASTESIMETKLSTTEATVMSQSLSNAVSTSQSSDSKTETQSSIKATETPVNTSPPEASSFRTATLSSISVTTAEHISPSQGIILPIVIALIVITLSVFVLVGLYRMCWKTDPGTQENGNEQPQSDKESVKLLTVKTISHESGLLFSFNAPWGESPVESILTANPARQSPVPMK